MTFPVVSAGYDHRLLSGNPSGCGEVSQLYKSPCERGLPPGVKLARSMTAKFQCRRPVLGSFICALLAVTSQIFFNGVRAQTSKITLISQETSTRAIAVDSITQKREPFNATSEVIWGNDNRTRVMLFAMGLDATATADSFSASGEDGSHRTYSLAGEFGGKVPKQEWTSSVIVRLPADIGDAGDVLSGISCGGVKSNRVRVGIGHVGDGPPDDSGAVPTPGTIAPPITPS